MTVDMKLAAKSDPFRSAGSIVDQLVQEHLGPAPCPALPTIDRLVHTANYCRQTSRPKNPTDLEFELKMDFIPDNFLKGDVTTGRKRHLIFSTDQQLQLLSRSKCWYADGTFKLVKEPFTQLFSVHSFIRREDCAKQIPLVFCLMSGRRKKDYMAVLEAIIGMLPQAPRVQRLVIDFESALWRAAASVIPDVQIKGCSFHWTQAVWRKIQDLGLREAYRSDNDTHRYLRKLMSLPFLPHQHIPAVFDGLKAEASTDQLTTLVEYLEATWILDATWTPDSWSVYFQSIRTNNDVEGWHFRLNNRGRPQVQLYLLVSLLHKEATHISNQLRI
ncbi:uncharacterized protein LOC121386108 [Gigantopelta aegis]|uniref:uncharacterized protein LOC121386108 n=1 Tax=Gigantopelta aegis TaxID=1735272 RepID=UPI001B88E11E|nr:uncharacterized protein LOC121386108 [Gigantopelta aegis]